MYWEKIWDMHTLLKCGNMQNMWQSHKTDMPSFSFVDIPLCAVILFGKAVCYVLLTVCGAGGFST